MDPTIIPATRAAIEQHGVRSLDVSDLTDADLPHIAWSGGPLHSQAVGDALRRAARGEVDYLAVRAPGGFPVCIGGVDYDKREGAGVLWQLATVGDLQGLGLGTRLILEAEQRIRQRSLATAMLGVEDNNPRARALYERLGYAAYDHTQESWKAVDPMGHVTVYHAEVTLMRKSLT